MCLILLKGIAEGRLLLLPSTFVLNSPFEPLHFPCFSMKSLIVRKDQENSLNIETVQELIIKQMYGKIDWTDAKLEEKNNLKITFLTKADLKRPKHEITHKQRQFRFAYITQHDLFMKYKPVLFGGAALAFQNCCFGSPMTHRVTDDLDFYVTDPQAYEKFKKHRTIDYENKKDYRIHFFEKIGHDFYIRVTVCLMPIWKHIQYESIKGINVLTLHELKKTKIIREGLDWSAIQAYHRHGSPSKYFVRKAKKGKDIADIDLINVIMTMRKIHY